ncbi:MAG: GspE/PulE family protein [Desulfobacterales bacterium]|nr:GspE/PulE family protein [Desulfobacterales bacterium]
MQKNPVMTRENLEHGLHLQDICTRIDKASNLTDTLSAMIPEMVACVKAERLSIFSYNGRQRELVTVVKSGDDLTEIRLPVTPNSIVGYAVGKKRVLRITDAYNNQELAGIDPGIKFDGRWDVRSGFATHQILVVPIAYKTFTLGAIQALNRIDGQPFSDREEQTAAILARHLGIALYNQKRSDQVKIEKFDFLLKQFLLSRKDLHKALIAAGKREEPVEETLIRNYGISRKDLGKSLSAYYRVPFVSFKDGTPVDIALFDNLKPSFLRNNTWVPLCVEKGRILVAIDDPNSLQRVDEIKSIFSDRQVGFCIALKKEILRYIDCCEKALKMRTSAPVRPASRANGKTGAGGETLAENPAGSRDAPTLAEIAASEEPTMVEEVLFQEGSEAAKLVNDIIVSAYERGTSDIHIEPRPDRRGTQVRFRIDGFCTEYKTLPHKHQQAVVSRLKIMADLDIAERRVPQDGKIKFKKHGGLDVELRVATVPTQGTGETVAIRLLANSKPMPLGGLGFSKRNYDNFIASISKPYGIVFVCGPTGSGKTTTLHSALGHINEPERKIWTAEDPIEITQTGLSQVQVKPKIGFDFAAALRAFLRADPDVIMVGEMRDRETAQIGIEASLTGHLVFSTLHTNSAPESITRLLNMGMEPFSFADAILSILAQRLAPTLCEACKQNFHPVEKQYRQLVAEYGGEQLYRKHNLPVYKESLTFYRANGCEVCNYTGYRGRMGLHELLMGTDAIKKLIEKQALVDEIRKQAIKDGMTTLKQDGIDKVFQGKSDLPQIRRVCMA